MRKHITCMLCGLLGAAPAAANQAAGPSIDDIHWHFVDSYCTFTREALDFVYDDPETWRFVLITNFPDGPGADPFEFAFLRIDGMLRELRKTRRTKDGEADIVVMATTDSPPLVAELRLKETGRGEEATAYSGVLKVSRADRQSSTPVKGDCGV
ncbi:MAG TPA: hypothetical protein PKE65_04135 [Rhizobiaceae bacterium]|nr:hypothetical protein [Rhizobiaceae bacterium]